MLFILCALLFPLIIVKIKKCFVTKYAKNCEISLIVACRYTYT